MANKRLDTIGDLIRHGIPLQVACRGCGRIRSMPAIEVAKHGIATGRPMDDGTLHLRAMWEP